MKYLHTHARARRLAVVVLLVGGVALIPALTHSARSANPHSSSSANGYVVSFYHHATLLGTTKVANGSGLDVVWKDTACSNGYGSPPSAFTWSGGSTGATSAPVMGPCGTAPSAMRPTGPDDLVCNFSLGPPYIDCYWTWKKSGGTATTSARIGNPATGNIALAYLFKRTALYAYLVTPGKPLQKKSVPAGADTIKFAPAP